MKVRKCCITCLTCDDYDSYDDENCKHCNSDIAQPSEYFEDLSKVNYDNTTRLEDLRDEVSKLEYVVEKFSKEWESTWNANGRTQWVLDNAEDYEV